MGTAVKMLREREREVFWNLIIKYMNMMCFKKMKLYVYIYNRYNK